MKRRLMAEMHWLYTWLTVQRSFWLPQWLRWRTFHRAMRLRQELYPTPPGLQWNNQAFTQSPLRPEIGINEAHEFPRPTLADIDAMIRALNNETEDDNEQS